VGDKLHLKLNISRSPIEHKYREGKMKRTLERELKDLEIVEKEADDTAELVHNTAQRYLFCSS
jgi:hypothetical protein